MDLFAYHKGGLFCEDVRVSDLVAEVGSPVYVYSAGTLRSHYQALADAFADVKPTICFAIKSLANLQVLKVLAAEGSGFDVVSGGELARALAVGAEPGRVVYAGVGKTSREINEAVAAGIGLFNVESEQEFENLSRLAAEAGKDVRAALRVNPDVDPKTHRYTTTGKKETKFGVDLERAERFFASYGRDENVALDGIHVHIGSPVYSPGPYVEAITKALALIERLGQAGFEVRTMNIGGGYAADYGIDRAPLASEYAEQIVPLLTGTSLEVILEPGRQIAANAGILVGRILYVKAGGERRFAIVDAAMTDLIRPALYDGFHFIWPLRSERPPQRSISYAPPGAGKMDVVGGVCESSGFLGKDRMLPSLERGGLLAVFSVGAYGFVMASQYNSRPRAPEVLVEGGKWRLVRRRETYEDLIGPEKDV